MKTIIAIALIVLFASCNNNIDNGKDKKPLNTVKADTVKVAGDSTKAQ
jgi:hypothetical protein